MFLSGATPAARGDGRARDADLPEEAAGAVARALYDLAKPERKDVVLELCAGQGEIGRFLSRGPFRYVGIDLDPKRLAKFRAGLPPPAPLLALANGNFDWPIRTGTVRVIFVSRAFDKLTIHGLMDESLRVGAGKSAVLVLGKLDRSPDSMEEVLDAELRKRLEQVGVRGARIDSGQASLFATLKTFGAKRIPSRTVASFKRRTTPSGILESFKKRVGLAGVRVPPSVKEDILRELERFARSTFGGVDKAEEADVEYVLDAIRLPADLRE